MVQSLAPTTPRAHHTTAEAPLSILRTETVLSRFPIHNLTTGSAVTIRITQTNAQGELDLRWAVSYNEYYGPPRHLAYKLDTIVVNQILDALPRPLPRVLKLGSLRHIGSLLDFQISGRQLTHLRNAFHQNASTYIVAYLRYRGRDGTERIVNTGFTRYSVIFTGEQLPDGTQADAVYLVLSDTYLDILNHAPVRPLDYAYLKILTPTAQRFYELLSYKMFATLKHHHPSATLRYADYCLLSTQQRYTVYDKVKKQMYKVHQPHLTSGYFVKVQYEATTDVEGQPDWLMHYTPGPKAHAEYAAFMRQPGAEAATARILAADADQEELVATVTREPPPAPPPPPAAVRTRPGAAPEASAGPPPRTQTTTPAAYPTPPADPCQAPAAVLVRHFYQRFHGLAHVTPTAKELGQATDLLAAHGAAKAHYLVDFSHQRAHATQYQPQVFGGILHYLDRAVAAYDAQTAQATQAATQRAAADERTQREQYQAWEQRHLEQLRAARPPAELAALEAAARAQLVAEGTPAFALRMGVRAAVDQVLAAQAGLPAFEAWRATQALACPTEEDRRDATMSA
jgi:hypothetical protein